MKVGVIILAHQGARQVAQLMGALRHPDVRLYLHVDSRVPLAPFEHALAASDISELTILPRHRTAWGTLGIVDASLAGLSAGVTDGCGYFMLITGQDFPLRPVAELVRFADDAGDRSYIQHWPVHDSMHRFAGRDRTDFYAFNVLGRRELCIPREDDASFLGPKGRLLNTVLRARSASLGSRGFPHYVRPYAGQACWNLSRSAAEYVLEFIGEHGDYHTYHKYTWVPDEIFYQSILAGSAFADQHQLVNESKRFYVWSGVRTRVLTVDDLSEIRASDGLFARKFDRDVDPIVLARVAGEVGVTLDAHDRRSR